MIKRYCDICGKEITNKTSKKVEIPCHLWSFAGKSGYVDTEGIPVSGKYDALDACTKCWNRVYSCMVEKIHSLRDDPFIPDDVDEHF
jgi:hypothetical protein